MEGTDLKTIIDVVTDAGVIGILVIAIWGGFKGWYVWKWQYQHLENEKEEWKKIALHGTDLAEAATDLLTKR